MSRIFGVSRIGRKLFKIGVPALICAMAVQASSITFVTPTGSTTGGGAVKASASFVTGDGGTLSITLINLQANPTDVAQLISDLDFTLSNGATAGTLSSSSGQQISVNSGGSTVLGSTGPTGWVLGPLGAGLQLTVLGTSTGPSGLIIGPGPYTNANGSIAANGPHNPFINQTATFSITGLSGVDHTTTITSATFSFGTTAGINVTGCIGTPDVAGCNTSPTPEPTTLSLMGAGLLGLGFIRRRVSK